MFLIEDDYNQKVNASDYSQLSGGDIANLAALEPDCIGEISSYLNSRYVLTGVFPDVITYNVANDNTNGQLVYDPTGKKFYNCIQDAPVGTLITDTGFFTLVAVTDPATNKPTNDPRNPVIKRFLTWLIIYEKFKSFNPRMVPDFVKEAREEAIKYFEHVSNPKHNVNIPGLVLITYADPKKSNNFSWGSRARVVTNKY